MPKHQRMLFSGWLFIVFICFSAGGFASNPEPGHHRILLLFSYHPEFPTTDKVIAGIHSVFPQGSVELDIEFMDSKRLYDAEMQSRFLRLLQYKLAHRKPYDVVVSADDNALNFLLSHRRHVLSDTPIVFLGVNNVQLAIDQDQVPDVTGVVEASSFRDTLTMMTTLFPGRKRLNVLVDPTPSGQADLQTLKGVQTDFPMLEVQERSLEDLTWDEWGQSLAMLDQNDMVLLLAAYRDRTGEARSFEEGLQLTMASLNQVPVFHLWEHGVGDGILGGTLVSHFQQGREAALMVQRIFLGEPVRDIAVLRKSPNVPTFDYDVLRQFSLSVDDVGSKARIINKPEVWRQYQDYFLVALMMLGILAVFTLLLLRSHARITLEKSLLKALIDSIPDVIFFKNESHQYLGCNKAFEAITGFTERHITGQHQQFVVNQELDELFSIDDQQVLTSRRTVRKEAWFELSHGRRMLLDVVKTPYFDPKGKLLGLIAICRDVTDRYYSEARLARSKELLTNAQQLAHIGSWELSVSSLNFECTRELFNIFGLENAEATVGREDFINCLLPKDREELISAYQRVLVEHEPINYVHSIVTPSGSTKYVHSQINVEFNEEQVPIRVYGTVQDMTEHRLTDERIRQAATVFEHAAEAIVLTDANSVIVDVNDAFEKITGYHRDEVLGKTPGLLKSGKHDELFYAAMWQDIKSQGNWQGEVWNRRKSGAIYPEWLTISAIKSPEGMVTGYVGISSDISALKHSQEQLDYLAHHDPLTALPNRLLLQARLTHSLERGQREHFGVAVLFLDLDGFKHINDSLGHSAGDELLKNIASHLRNRVRQEDTIARIGGDEFVIVMEHIDEIGQVTILVDQLLQSFYLPKCVGGHEMVVSASIGISMYPRDASDVPTLLRNADAAMYKAKERGRNTYEFYTPQLTEEAFLRVKMEAEIRMAIEREEFTVYFQPQIDLNTGLVTGAEVLARWLHSERGIVPPVEFIALAEQNGQIIELGEVILRLACRQWRCWSDNGYVLPFIAVNFSARQFEDPRLIERVKAIFAAEAFPAERLEIEITEGHLMKKVEQTSAMLEELKSLGCTVAIDDFGTGYSSLSSLKKLPVNRLKIDRSFVQDLPRDEDDRVIARAIVALSHSLRLDVVAEGIETGDQLLILKEEGCLIGQGYLFCPPLPAATFEKLLLEEGKLETQSLKGSPVSLN